jgi:hypothetical protein
MVLHPEDYSDPHPDADLVFYNSSRKKKDRVEFLHDIVYAQSIAQDLSDRLGLNIEACHDLDQDIDDDDYDFVFSEGVDWLDQGPWIIKKMVSY